QLLQENPFTTLQVVLEPTGDCRALTPAVLEELLAACQVRPTYLDRFYALQPGRPIGAKRLIILVDWDERERLGKEWSESVGEFATIMWRGTEGERAELDEYEHVLA